MMLREREAANHIATGMEKLRSRDGKACLAELDKHDALDKRPQMLSTRPESSMALSRSLCLMLAGRCPEGRELAKKSFQANRDVGKEQVPAILDAYTSRYCEGALSPRDELIKAWTDLAQKSSMGSPASAECSKSYETVRRLATTVKPRDEDDHMVRGAVAPSLGFVAARCFGRAGDCAAARLAYDDGMAATRPGAPPLPPAAAQSGFDGVVPSCKGR